MVCVTVAEKSVEALRAALGGLAFAEVRMDAAEMSVHDALSLFTGRARLIATCRPHGFNHSRRAALLLAAIEGGASYVDIELESDSGFRDVIVAKARLKGCRVILSYHNYEGTPERAELDRIADRCFEAGADIAKIACLAQSREDNGRLLGLLGGKRPIVAIGMGKVGSITRVLAPLLGSPFTYGALKQGKEVVEGQLDYRTILRHLEALGPLSGEERAR